MNLIDPGASLETIEVTMEDLLAYKAEGFGWGQIKHAKALSELDNDFDGSLEGALIALGELGWGELKKEIEYSGPPPWAKGGGKSVEELQDMGDEGKKFDGDNEGPPYGKAKGHNKNKDKGK
jgi:hypothetical protein